VIFTECLLFTVAVVKLCVDVGCCISSKINTWMRCRLTSVLCS